MCIFNEPVKKVCKTQIFVGPTKDKRQLTIYQNEVEVSGPANPFSFTGVVANKPNAMILPCPLNEGWTVSLVDLSNYAEFFSDCDKSFPSLVNNSRSFGGSWSLSSSSSDYLEVHAVGGYNVSVAKNIEELKRINPNVFVLSPNVDQILANHYPFGFAFVVCMFDVTKGVKPHPIGYIHSLLNADSQMFVPTRHEHGGFYDPDWDHMIYSTNTSNQGNSHSGLTPLELQYELEKKKKQFETVSVPKNVAIKWNKIPTLDDIHTIRRREIVGKHVNADLVFQLSSGAMPPQQQPQDYGWHPNVFCDNCHNAIGHKSRFKCLNCPDFDLCGQCEEKDNVVFSHKGGAHLFMKVRDSRMYTRDYIEGFKKVI